MKTRLFLCLFLFALFAKAADKPVTTANFNTVYAAAEDGDVLLLASGNYVTAFKIPSGKAITLKAAEDATPILKLDVNADANTSGGSLIFDGITIDRAGNYFISYNDASMNKIEFRNCNITNINRCLINAGGTGRINEVIIDNSIIGNTATSYCFLYFTSANILGSLSITNSTLYNYGGEHLFWGRAEDESNVFSFVFKNNTVYNWAKNSSYGFCKVEKYNASSTYTFENNIINKSGTDGASPYAVITNTGVVKSENNLVVESSNFNTTPKAGWNIKADYSLSDFSLATIGFPDPAHGDFTILSTSPLATAGKNNECLGNPSWIKNLSVAVNLTTNVFPENAGTVSPISAAYEKGKEITVAASKNYGFKFKEWQIEGIAVSTENPYTFSITEDTDITAVFENINTYTLTVNKAGDGANWGKVVLDPQPVNGRYEENTVVKMSVVPNAVSSFLYWENNTSELTRQVTMSENKEFTANFDWIPFIVGWNFDPAEPRNNRPGDYYNRADNQGLMSFFNGDGSSTNWGGSTKEFGGTTYTCARRYTPLAEMSKPRYFQASFSTKGYESDYESVKYKTIHIKSYIGADNECVHKIQKMQYATSESGPFIDLVNVDMSSAYNTQWIECNATLPEALTEKETIYIRWIADTNSELIGSPAANATEGFYLANVLVFAELEGIADSVSPVLLSSIPGEGTSTASANGSIVLTFNERVKAGQNQGKVVFNGKTLVPTFGSKTVIYQYSGLDYGATYTFTLPSGVITDMSGNEFAGKTIAFATMTRPQPDARLFDAVVAADGTGDYTTVQAAVNNTPSNRTTPWLIFIKNGTYKEVVRIPQEKSYIYLIGQEKENVIITYAINAGSSSADTGWEYAAANMGIDGGGVVVRVDAPNFYAENISFINKYGVDFQSGPMALAMYSNNDRFAFYNCTFRSFQDTWQTSSRNVNDRLYVRDCWIEGAVDYFYGAGNAFVDECTLYNVRSGAVIVAPSHKAGTLWGYVFNNCIVDGNTLANDGKLKLGRPWHNEPQAVYLNTTMKITPHPEGWTDMGPAAKLFAEYNSMDSSGNTIDLSQRRTWYQQSASEGGQKIEGLKAVLSQEEAAVYTYENVMSGSDNWNPKAYYEKVDKPSELKINEAKTSLTWNTCKYAICYVIYENGKAIGFTKVNSYEISPLQSQAAKTYEVQAVNEYGSLGEMSDPLEIPLTTSILDETVKDKPNVTIVEKGILVNSDVQDSLVSLFTIDGHLIHQAKANFDTVYIPISANGVYILRVGTYSMKLLF